MAQSMTFDINATDRASAAFTKLAENVDKLERKLRDLDKVKADPKVTVDTRQADKDLTAFEKKFERAVRNLPKAKLDVDVDGLTAAERKIDQLKAKMSSLSNARVKVDLDVADSSAIAALRADLASLSNTNIRIDLDATKARADITAISTRLQGLRDTNVKVNLDTGNALAEVTQLELKLTELKVLSPLKLRVELDDQASAQLTAIRVAAAAVAAASPSIRVDADTAAALAQLAAVASALGALGTGSTTVRVQLDQLTFLGQLARVQAELKALSGGTVRIDADTRQAMEQLAALRVRLAELSQMSPTATVRADTELARHQIELLERQLAGIAGRQYTANVDVDKGGVASARMVALGAAALYAVPALGALSASAASLVGSLVAAAGAAGLLPAALAGIGGAFGAIKLGVSGVGDTFKALTAEQDAAASSAASNAGQQSAAAKQIASAVRGVEDATRQADRTAVDGARQVQDARRAVADAITASNERVAAAEENVQRAQETRLRAQQDLTRAIEDAKEAQENLTLALSGAALSEESALLSVERARERLANMPKDSTALDFKEAELAIRQAEQAVLETKERHIDLQQESAKSAAVGIMGADGVVDAQGRVTDANRGVTAAEAALTKARTDGARDVSRANEQLARAQESAARANEDASRQVQRAQEQLAEAYQTTSNTGVAAAAKSAAAMAKLAPAAQEFVKAVMAIQPAWDSVKMDVQQRLFEGLGAAVTKLADAQLPNLRTGLTAIAGGFNDSAREAMAFLAEGARVDDVKKILDSTAKSTKSWSSALTPITSMFIDFGVVGGPILEELATGFAAAADRAAAFIANARLTGQLEGWIRGGLDVLAQLGSVAGNVGSVLGSVFTAAKASGADFLNTLDRITAGVAEFMRSAQGQSTLVKFFQECRAAIDAVLPGLQTLGVAAAGAIAAFSDTGGLVTFGQAISNAAEAVAPLVVALGGLAGGTLGALGGGLSVAAAAFAPLASAAIAVVDALGPVAPMVLGMVVAFRGLQFANAAITGLGASVAAMAGRMGAGEAATGRVATAFSRAGSAVPIFGAALVAVGAVMSATQSRAEDLAGSVLAGSLSMQQAVAAEVKQLENRDFWFSLSADSASDATMQQARQAEALANVTAEYEKQRAVMSPFQQLQADVAMAQNRLNDAVAKYTAASPQARAAAEVYASAQDKLKTAQDGAAGATQTHTDKMLEQQRAAFAAFDTDLAYLDSIDRIAEAQLRAADAAREHGAGSTEAAAAARDVLRANLDAAAAAGAKAQADAEATGAANAAEIGARAQKDELIRLANQASGPTRDALLAMANGTDLSGRAAATAEVQARLHKDELGRLAVEADGPLKAALAEATKNFDTLGGANATAEQKAKAQKDELLRLAQMASGPLRDELLRMADQVRTLPDKTFTVTADGKMGPIFGGPGGPEGGTDAHAATGGIISSPGSNLGVVRRAGGGVLPGYTPGRDVHRFVGAAGALELSGGEAIMRPEWTRAVGSGFVHGANAAARKGGVGGVSDYIQRVSPRDGSGEGVRGDGSAFARGGIYGRYAGGGIVRAGVQPYAKIAGDRDTDVSMSMAKILAPLMAAKVKAAEDAARAAAAAAAGGGGPVTAGAQAGLDWARTQVGKPYVWGGVGPGGYDCSGFMSAIVNVMRGRNPHSRVGATSNFPWAGFAPGIGAGLNVGSFTGNPGHMAGTIGGTNVESSGSVGVRVGGGARGAGDGMFNVRAHLADRGSLMRTGTAAVNLSGQPERVLSPEQTRVYDRILEAQAGRSPVPLPNVAAAQMQSNAGMEKRLDQLVQLIERRGAGATINVNDSSGDPSETARSTMLALRLS